MALLEVQGLTIDFNTPGGVVRAVDGVSFTIEPGEAWCLVGESGSGKSATALALLGLLPAATARVVAGTVALCGTGGDLRLDLTRAKEAAWQRIRGRRVAMVFQDPLSSLNPYLTIGRQLTEVVQVRRATKPAAARQAAVDVLELVGFPAPEARLSSYAHELSGGMRQRVLIAMALLGRPELLIADEPTSALDVTVQAQVLSLLKQRRDEHELAIMLITHDMGVVAKLADRVAVMYASHIVEAGPVEAVFHRPLHPYTAALLRAVPRLDTPLDDDPVPVIPGAPPAPFERPSGCPFRPRCALAEDICAQSFPPRRDSADGLREVFCHAEESEP